MSFGGIGKSKRQYSYSQPKQIDIIGNYNMQYSNRETNNLIIIGKNI